MHAHHRRGCGGASLQGRMHTGGRQTHPRGQARLPAGRGEEQRHSGEPCLEWKGAGCADKWLHSGACLRVVVGKVLVDDAGEVEHLGQANGGVQSRRANDSAVSRRFGPVSTTVHTHATASAFRKKLMNARLAPRVLRDARTVGRRHELAPFLKKPATGERTSWL